MKSINANPRLIAMATTVLMTDPSLVSNPGRILRYPADAAVDVERPHILSYSTRSRRASIARLVVSARVSALWPFNSWATGVMAVFGAPLAHEDHAVRACYVIYAPDRPRPDRASLDFVWEPCDARLRPPSGL